jgi:uncharacterized protein (DUF433 family)
VSELPPVKVPHPHVEARDDLLAGSPVVRGTRVPVRRLWSWHRRGITVETLLKRYPKLGPARVLDALAFAYDNQALVEADLTRERDLVGAEGAKASARRGQGGEDPDAIPGAMTQEDLPFSAETKPSVK